VRLGYRYLGLKIVSLEENLSFYPKKPPMAEEKRDDRVGDHFNSFLEESLMQKRNEMIDNFA
jgi:hypothetical protein